MEECRLNTARLVLCCLDGERVVGTCNNDNSVRVSSDC